ncbi:MULTISPECIES: DUF7210 family protein [Pseudomonas]|uniref:Uncharacterized protein n=1 Tax=Pseudomonas nitroreducens TaxID=46680 RepID=A0A6G6ISQ9_PSENT|nr:MULTISPECIES: hypothetical protein [Pseudomonas]OBY90696.1 hypothetical protein A6723_020935 [Pseudomonas sp. AU11447]PJI49767.1 MAG: hypothetical protein CTR55_10530 [Pseudomonas sp.]QIE86148.1 hypothetical protein G5B91_07675 [Pseudomonas nitroreducens]
MKVEKAPASAGETKPADVKVKITHDNGHRHAGTKHPKDAVITVTEADAKLIEEHFKVGERVKGE